MVRSLLQRKVLWIYALFLGICVDLFAQPIVSVVIMVKNEESSIQATLQPLFDGGIRDFLVYDTGSTDRTVALVQQWFQKQNIERGYIVEEPFVDFATSRNRALEHAEKHFPTSVFFLMLDAEWFLNNTAQLISWCSAHEHDTESVYLIKIANETTSFYTARLLRRAAGLRFVGVVHEHLDKPAKVMLPDDIWFLYRPSERGVEQTKMRWLRDAALLEAAYAKDPTHARTVFFLAQTYGALERYEDAYHWYGIRRGLDGYIEETFLAHYRMGLIAEHLMQKGVAGFDWQRAQSHYLDAFSFRPIRAEPLVKMAHHYWKTGDKQLCFLFARRAAELSYPADYFCVEKYMYDFTRYDLLGASAPSVAAYSLGEWAVDKALAFCQRMGPHVLEHASMAHLKKNKALYQQMHGAR